MERVGLVVIIVRKLSRPTRHLIEKCAISMIACLWNVWSTCGLVRRFVLEGSLHLAAPVCSFMFICFQLLETISTKHKVRLTRNWIHPHKQHRWPLNFHSSGFSLVQMFVFQKEQVLRISLQEVWAISRAKFNHLGVESNNWELKKWRICRFWGVC